MAQNTASTPDHLPRAYASREPLTGAPLGSASVGYQGSSYYDTVHNLALCYEVVHDSDPARAQRYGKQGVKVLQAMSAPFATAKVVQTGFRRVLWYIDNTGPGGQAQAYVNWPGPEIAKGTQVEIAGALGCTAANGLRQVASVTGNSFLLADTNGQPVICEGPGTNYNHNFLSDSGYPIRFFLPALAIGYDWLYDLLDDATKQQIWATMNAWVDEFHLLYAKNGGLPYRTRTQSNYHAGYYAAVGLAAIATRGENPQGEALYQMWRNEIHLGRDQPHFQRWLGPYGGFPEAWSYLPLSVTGIGMTLLSNLTAFGDDLINHPTQPLPWMTGLMRNYIHGTTPGLTHLVERGFVPAPVATGNDPLRTSPSMFFVPYYLGKIYHDPITPYFKQFFDDVLGRFLKLSGTNAWTALWQRFLFYDPSDPSADWHIEQLSLPILANPDGGYGEVLMRSDWGDNAVYGSFLAHPQCSDSYNGKERMDKGSLIVQAGSTHLLVSPLAEAVRAGNTAAFSFFSNNNGVETIPPPQNLAYGLYYITRPGWTSHQWPAISRLSLRSPGSNDIPPDAPKASIFQVSSASGGVLSANNHGLKDGDLVYFYTTGSFPPGLQDGAVYYVRESRQGSFRLSLSSGKSSCAAAQDCINVDGSWQGALMGSGSGAAFITTRHPTRIDVYEDQDAYVYSRGVGLETLFSYDEQDPSLFPVGQWDREILYLRPKLFVVYDRTQKREKPRANPPLTYTQYMAWTFGKTPQVTSATGDDVLRVDVSDGPTYKGALTAVLPAKPQATIADLGSYGIVYQLRVAPPQETEFTNWLTVVDAATSPGAVSRVERLTTTQGLDAVELDGSTVAGFVTDAHTDSRLSYTVKGSGVTMHVIAGVIPGATYRVDWDGTTMLLTSNSRRHGGTAISVVASSAGVLYVRTPSQQGPVAAAKPNGSELRQFPRLNFTQRSARKKKP